MKMYKQFRIDRDGNLHPLFVDTDRTIPIGRWLTAELGERTESGKVRSKLGPLAYRPGWHLSEAPYAPHIGVKVNGEIRYMHPDTVWALCEISSDVDYTAEARKRGTRNGKLIAREACLDRLPENGFYWYNTNPKAFGNWIIAHRIRVIAVLDDDQVENICMTKFGIHSQPHEPGHKFVNRKGA